MGLNERQGRFGIEKQQPGAICQKRLDGRAPRLDKKTSKSGTRTEHCRFGDFHLNSTKKVQAQKFVMSTTKMHLEREESQQTKRGYTI